MRYLVFCVCLILSVQPVVLAHQSSATYVANEAVLITNGDKKVLFDATVGGETNTLTSD